MIPLVGFEIYKAIRFSDLLPADKNEEVGKSAMTRGPILANY